MTSPSDSFQIFTVDTPGGGAIGMAPCPGRPAPGTLDGEGKGDLDADLREVQRWGATVLVSLLDERESQECGVGELAGRLPAGIEHCRLPITDGGVPDDSWERLWAHVGPGIRRRLLARERIVVHCRAGRGRSGVVAARLLVELGLPARKAIAAVRAARTGAIENGLQERYVRKQRAVVEAPSVRPYHRLEPGRVSRYRGCLLGGAVGDALGAAVEFSPLAEIRRRYGPQGIQRPDRAYGRVGAITDDTQMTLFTAEGLLRGAVRQAKKGISDARDVVAHAYLRWLHTQDPDVRLAPSDPPGLLLGVQELYSARAPGATCLQSLRHRVDHPDVWPAANDSKGCGGVMRAAPVGLIAATLGQDPARTYEIGCEVAAVTHGHPTGQHPAGAFAVMVAELVRGQALDAALATAQRLLADRDPNRETLTALQQARELAVSGTPEERALVELGEGWVAEQALAIAVFCALRASSLESGVLLAVNITGDSDSTGAITGNLLGAERGLHEIPDAWLDVLELRELITEVADDLCSAALWEVSEQGGRDDAYWWARYPGF